MSAFELPTSEATRYIWIFRKWNGQAAVYPSPAILKAGADVFFVNKTGEEANVTFPDGYMDPKVVCVSPGSSSSTRAVNPASYLEYEVSFTRASGPPAYAEGGSRPGVIIEH